MIKKTLLIFIPIFLLLSCSKFIKSDAEKYFDETFNLIKENSVKKNEIIWNELKRTVRDSIKYLKSNYDAHLAISYTVKLINDGHSLFGVPQKNNIKAINSRTINSKNVHNIPPIIAEILDNDIGYIKLTGLHNIKLKELNIIDDSLSKIYTLEIRKSLLNLDKSAKLSGWIIDLRSHGGGVLSCESLGLSPLFINPLIGFHWNNKNIYNEIICTNTYFKFGNQIQERLLYDSIITNKNKKIAILVDNKTASAGEFLALAFKFQDNTKTFGKPTRGKTSHCTFYILRDNAILNLVMAYYYDKNRNVIKNGIIPDIECDSEASLTEALKWIKNSI